MKLLPEGKSAWRRMGLRLLIFLALLAAFPLAMLWYCVAMPGSSFAGPTPTASAEDQRLAARLRGHVTMLAETIGERHDRKPEALRRAATYIREQLAALGFEVKSQRFRVAAEVENLEVVLHGTSRAEERLIIGAHFDTAANTPGADDNASGVAALLEVARWLRGKRSPRTVHLVAFTNEEPPYFGTTQMGSYRYAQRAAERGWNVVGMLCLESIGFYSDGAKSQRYPPPVGWLYPHRGNFITFVGNLDSRSFTRRTVKLFRRHGKIASEGIAAPTWVNGVDFSDHKNFWDRGFPALMVTDTAPFRNRHYHKGSDTPETLDYRKLALVTQGLLPVIEALAEGP